MRKECWRGQRESLLDVPERRIPVVPHDTVPRSERVLERREHAAHRRHPLERGDQEGGAPFVREHHRRLATECEAFRCGVVTEEAVGGLGGEPLTEMTLVETGTVGELARRHGPAAGHGLPEAELVAERDQRRVDRGGRLAAGEAGELLQRGRVIRGVVRGIRTGHGRSFRSNCAT